MRSFTEELTPREWAIHNNEKEVLELQMAHAMRMKELEIEVAKVEARFNSLLRLPSLIILLPVKVLLVIPLSIYAAKSKEVPEQLWKFF